MGHLGRGQKLGQQRSLNLNVNTLKATFSIQGVRSVSLGYDVPLVSYIIQKIQLFKFSNFAVCCGSMSVLGSSLYRTDSVICKGMVTIVTIVTIVTWTSHMFEWVRGLKKLGM